VAGSVDVSETVHGPRAFDPEVTFRIAIHSSTGYKVADTP
jgi:hypothetical protein